MKSLAVLEARALNLPLEIFDLGAVDPETVNCSLTLRAVLYTLKYVRNPDFPGRLPKIAEMLRKAALRDIEKVISYILDYRDESPEELVELAAHIREDRVRRMIMSTAEQLIERGIERGIKKCIERR